MSTSGAQTYWLDQLGEAGAYNRWICAQVLSVIRGDVLEVGCGIGTFSRLFAPVADRVTAIDIDRASVQQARELTDPQANISYLCADAVRDLPGERFDAIVMLDVLEHIAEDVVLLKRLSDRLKDQGRLVLKVPAIPALYNRMDGVIGHHRRYSAAGLQRTLCQAGLEPDRIWAFNLPGIVGWWWNGTVCRRTTPPEAHIGGFNRIVPLVARLERWLRPPIGLSLFAVARRRALSTDKALR